MFYPCLIEYLREDPALAAAVSDYDTDSGAIPAIFADYAPEDADLPYAVVRISSTTLSDSAVVTSDVNIDYWDYDKSRATADQWARDITDRLDTILLRPDSPGDSVTDIRFSLGSEGYILDKDPRVVHYNSTFSTRAARSRWMRETLA